MDPAKLIEAKAQVPPKDTPARKTWREYFAQRTKDSYVPSRQSLVMLLRNGLGNFGTLSDEALYCVRWLSKRTGVRMSRIIPDLILTAIPDHPVYKRYVDELVKALKDEEPLDSAAPGADVGE